MSEKIVFMVRLLVTRCVQKQFRRPDTGDNVTCAGLELHADFRSARCNAATRMDVAATVRAHRVGVAMVQTGAELVMGSGHLLARSARLNAVHLSTLGNALRKTRTSSALPGSLIHATRAE